MKQAQALHVMKQGESVFVTGPAGSGKTYVLNQFIAWLRRQKKQVAVTASTGIAATHLGGTTIHSWSGLGIRDALNEYDKAWLKANDRLSKRYNATDVLIIDEVSMLHGRRLDMINEACKILRGNDKPFGGLQVILTGDLFQLPPVNRGGGADDFAHTSAAWQELDPKICYITEQHRQQDDELLSVLEAMRSGELEQSHQELLMSRVGAQPNASTVPTRLYSHNIDVETINDRHLKALNEEVHVYEMATSGRAKSVEQLQKSVLAPTRLELKKGAEVMFVANNFAQGFVNGSRGKVVDFNGDTPIVQLQTGKKTIAVEPHAWILNEDGRERARVTQLPLRLAWAITIHKSQGMSLDSALIDLSRSFTYGMGYVALSRVRSLDGLYLAGLNRMALELHPDIFAFDAALRQASRELARAVGEVREEPENEEDEAEQPTTLDDPLFEALRTWRLERARERGIAAYMIAHNKTLEAIVLRKPKSEHALLAVPGIGKKFLETYGPQVIALVVADAPDEPGQESPPDAHEEILDYIAGKGIELTPEKRAKILRLLEHD